MGEPKFTPGPWYVGAMNDALLVIDQQPRPSTDDPNHEAKTQSIAIVTVKRDLHVYAANASLIAAAPELYRALSAAQAALKSYQYGNSSTELAQEIGAFADRALAKAEGRS